MSYNEKCAWCGKQLGRTIDGRWSRNNGDNYCSRKCYESAIAADERNAAKRRQEIEDAGGILPWLKSKFLRYLMVMCPGLLIFLTTCLIDQCKK